MHGETLPVAALDDLVQERSEKAVGRKKTEWPYLGLEHLATDSPFLLGSLPSSASTSTNNVFHAGDVLFGKLRPYLRKSVGVAFSGYCSTDLLVLQPRPGVDAAFAGKVFQSAHVFSKAVETSIGTKMPRTSWRHLRQMEVFRPPLPEQRRIAEILDTIDEAIRKTEQVITKLQQMKQGLLHDLLTRGIDENGELRDPERHPEQFQDSLLGRIPRTWRTALLGDETTWLSGGTPTKSVPAYWGGDIPWVSPKDMKQFRTGDAQDRVTAVGAAIGSKIAPPNAVLIVVRGMILAHTFPVCLTTCELAFNQDVKAVVAGSNLNGTFLGHWFVGNAKPLLGLVTEATHGTKRIELADLRKFALRLPQIGEQERIAAILDLQDARIDGEREAVAKLRTLKHGLMDDLLTGRVRLRPKS